MFRETPTEEGKKGLMSYRRVSGFYFGGVFGVIAGLIAIMIRSDWTVVAVAIGIPFAVLVIMGVLTTIGDIKIEDVKGIVEAAKGVKRDET